jgi:hypothetical protein
MQRRKGGGRGNVKPKLKQRAVLDNQYNLRMPLWLKRKYRQSVCPSHLGCIRAKLMNSIPIILVLSSWFCGFGNTGRSILHSFVCTLILESDRSRSDAQGTLAIAHLVQRKQPPAITGLKSLLSIGQTSADRLILLNGGPSLPERLAHSTPTKGLDPLGY